MNIPGKKLIKLKKRYILIPVLLIAFLFVFFNIHTFLAPRKTVSTARILVVDAWVGDSELKEAVEVFKAGNYSHVLVPGGEIDRSLFFRGMDGGDISAVMLMYHGIPPQVITPLKVNGVKKDRTYQSALTVKKWIHKNNLDSCDLNLFTSNAHARRSWFLYKKAFKNECRVGIHAARPTKYNPERWWRTSNGFRTVVDESIAFVYAFLFFHPDL